MVRATHSGHFIRGKQYIEFAGLSTDPKPTAGILTGSLFLEVDTGDVYAFDETGNGAWTKIASLGGGDNT